MTGVVDSKFHANDSDFKLPPGSRYTSIEGIIATWASGEAKPKGGSAEQFAESVVEDIVGSGKGGVVYRGAHSGSVKFMVNWLPSSLGVCNLFDFHVSSLSIPCHDQGLMRYCAFRTFS